jgi:prepilin-type processing-associated H-X9-DG protein
MALVLSNHLANDKIWFCPNFSSPQLQVLPQATQLSRSNDPASSVTYWFWRFDRIDDPVPLDNFWSKTVAQSIVDLAAANNPQAGQPTSASEVELSVDPYFPNTISALPAEVRGVSVHPKGRNVLYLDSHTAFVRDTRLK